MDRSNRGESEPDYAEWQGILAAAFFSTPDVPVVMFAADDELDRLASAHAGRRPGAEALAHAVRPFVRLADHANMFASLRDLRAAWRTSRTGPPPTLPVLALTVLAATRMRRDNQGSSSNYYLRMAQALLPDAGPAEVEEARTHMLGAFERDVAPMWRELHEWMGRADGRFGISTVRPHPHLTNIGYPLSQALVRTSDKALLTRFFAAIDVVGAGVPAEGALLVYLRLWAARQRTLSDTLRSALEDDALSAMIGAIVSGLASAWDGRIVTPEGLRRLEVALVLDVEGWQGRWLLKAAESVELSGRVAGKDCSLTAVPAAFGPYAFMDGLPEPTGAIVKDGFRLDGSGVTAEFVGAQLAALRQDADAGGWVSCDGIEPYVDHVLALHPDLATTVKEVLTAAADEGWRALPQRPGDPLLAGYVLYRKVRFSDPKKLDDALADLHGHAKQLLRPVVTARPRLAYGLPLLRSLAMGCYLAGGEPDLLLPVAEEARSVPVTFDGASQVFTASGFPIPLSVLPGIELGDHEVEADGERLRFTVLDRSPVDGHARMTGALGWEPASGVLKTDGGPKTIRGALAPACVEELEPVLVRRGASASWWLYPDGDCAPLTEPDEAPLLEAVGLKSVFYEAERPASAAWLVQKRRLSWSPPVLLRRLPPEFRRPGPAARMVWDELTGPQAPRPGEAEAGLWALYVRAWGLTRARG